jgi:hypothetical protein
MTIAVAIGITVAVEVEVDLGDVVEEEGLEELFRVVVAATDHVDKTALHTPIGNRAYNKKHSCNMRRIDFGNMIITTL